LIEDQAQNERHEEKRWVSIRENDFEVVRRLPNNVDEDASDEALET
jgi:hypothetical protein